MKTQMLLTEVSASGHNSFTTSQLVQIVGRWWRQVRRQEGAQQREAPGEQLQPSENQAGGLAGDEAADAAASGRSWRRRIGTCRWACEATRPGPW